MENTNINANIENKSIVIIKNKRKKATKAEIQISKYKKAPAGFLIQEEIKSKVNSKDEKKGHKQPKINELKEKTLKGNSDGSKALKAENAKAIRIIIDGVEYSEKEFAMLFPNKYLKFNIKRDFLETKEIKGKLVAIKSVYFYFPAEMIAEHEIIVKYRKKMDLYTYNISKDADSYSSEEAIED